MQIHNGIKYYTQLLGGMNVATGVSRDASGIERLGETLQPSIDPWLMPEWYLLRQEVLWCGSQFQAAVVAEGSMVAIVNPVARNNIVTLEYLALVNGAAAQTVNIGWCTEAQASGTLTLGNPPHYADNRETRTVSPANAYKIAPVDRYVGSDPTVTFNSVIEQLSAPANSLQIGYNKYVLRPGSGIWIQGSTVNTSILVNTSGRVRAALPGENQLG